jgi:hypothetical protein
MIEVCSDEMYICLEVSDNDTSTLYQNLKKFCSFYLEGKKVDGVFDVFLLFEEENNFKEAKELIHDHTVNSNILFLNRS